VRLCQGSKSLMLITVLLAESAQIGNTNAILPMTTAASAGSYLLSTTPRSKAKTVHLLYREVAGCATGSARLLGAHVRGGLLSLYTSGCSFFQVSMVARPRRLSSHLACLPNFSELRKGEVRRIFIPRNRVNKGKRKVPVIGWGDHDNCRGCFPLPCAEHHHPRFVLPLGRSVVGHPKPHAHKSYVAQGLGIHSHIHIRPHRFSDRRHGCLVYLR
jgi:hypothetical protein